MGDDTNTRTNWRFVTALAFACALIFAACGGEEDQDSASTEVGGVVENNTPTTRRPPTTTTVVSTTASTEPPPVSGLPEFTSDSSVSTVGIDELNFGMTVTQAGQAVGGTFVPVNGTDPVCHLVRPSGGPVGVQLTVTEGTIERVDVTTPDITTRSGAGVGMTEAGLAELFGNSLTTRSSNTGGNQVIFTPSDPSDAEFRVIFETNGETVTSFRSGRLPQVEPTQPCG